MRADLGRRRRGSQVRGMPGIPRRRRSALTCRVAAVGGAPPCATNRVYRIAVIPGDGIGKEVMPEGVRVLEAAAKKFGFELRKTISISPPTTTTPSIRR